MKNFSKCEPASRYDFVEWPKFKMLLCALFFAPIKIIMAITIIFFGSKEVILSFTLFGKGKLLDKQSKIYWWWQNLYFLPQCRINYFG